MTLVVTLAVRRDAIGAFRAFERGAAALMARHGGRIERTVVATGEDSADVVTEVHVVTFPHAQALAAYRADPGLREIAHLREASVARTEILVGEDGPDYHAA